MSPFAAFAVWLSVIVVAIVLLDKGGGLRRLVQIVFLQLWNKFFFCFVLLVIKTSIRNVGERNCFSNTPL